MNSIDASYIWQRRIAHSVRYQKGAVPFPDSVEIGVEFNAALERKEKMDESLLTNAVMLDICDFAKTVTKSEKYFLFEMLEFNFDLGVDLDNDQLCYIYSLRVHNKIKQLKDQVKMKPNRLKEQFSLPDPNLFLASAESEESGLYCPKWNKIADSSVLTHGSKNSQASENQKAESNSVTCHAFVIKKRGGFRLKVTNDAYPFCSQLGVSLDVRPNQAPKQKLDRNLITIGVMMELLDFSRALCGSHTVIVYDLVTHNFTYELDKMQLRMQLNKLIERKYMNLTPADKDAFRKEHFRTQTNKKYKKRKKPEADYQDLERQTTASKRRETLRQRASDAADIWQDGDLSYMCPLDFETEMLLETEAGPEDTMPDSYLSGTNLLQDVKLEEEEVSVSPVQPQTNGHTSDDIRIETPKQRLWLRRAARTKQILMSSRVHDMFAHCREIGLNFNVCSGAKQNLDLRLFTNRVLWEVCRFATSMTKSVRSFFFDVMCKNFNLMLQNELHERNFLVYMITKEKALQHHPDRQKVEFLSRPIQFPEVYNMVDVTSNFQSVKAEPDENVDSSDSATSQETDVETHPFCRKLGVNLWATEERPASQKFCLTVLTVGAVLEILSFVRVLCGTTCEIVNDVLEHNFDLDLQRGDTEAAKVILRWYSTQKSMKKLNMSPKVTRWLSMPVPLNGHSRLDPEPPTSNGLRDPEDVKLGSATAAFNGDSGLVKRINSYDICKEIGLDLDVRSKSDTKAKLDLQVLTRGVLLEMHQYVEQNSNRYVPALYEILEYNFDLSSQSHRKVEFAWSFASQVRAIASKNGRKGDYLSQVFELPFEVSESAKTVCKEELEDGFRETDVNGDDILFVRKLKPVDIEVEID